MVYQKLLLRNENAMNSWKFHINSNAKYKDHYVSLMQVNK